jgi:hypothetical protein
LANIFKVLEGDYSSYSQKDKEYMINFSEKLKEALKKELVLERAEKLIKDLNASKTQFIMDIEDLLEEGFEGFKTMSLKTLLDIYLEKRSDEEFINLIEKISSEI